MYTSESFTIKKAVGFAYAMYKEKPWLMLAVLLANIVLLSLSDIAALWQVSSLTSDVLDIVSLVFSGITILGTIYISLKLYDGKDARFSDIVAPIRKFFIFFIAKILYCLLVLLGLIVFIVPGIYVYLKYQYFAHAMVYKNMGIVESFKESARITQGELWHLAKYQLVILLLNISGFITIIGFLITLPMTYLADAYVYRKLSTPKQEGDAVSDEAQEILASFEKNAIAASEV